MNQLDQLKQFSTVVADTGDFESIRTYEPQDATTNPTLILQAAKKPEYKHLIEKAVRDTKSIPSLEKRRMALINKLFVNFGLELLQIIPGRVSTEVAAMLSFDTKGSIEQAQNIIALYEREGIPRERILIKLAATWEGIRAAEVLEMEDIHCNMTLIFSLAQAAGCAEARATLVSPFVGRILDWHQKQNPKTYSGDEDPGVLSVKDIYCYLKKFDYPTQVMGASFRNKGEIEALAGCDLLTIAPKFLEELKSSCAPLERKLSLSLAQNSAFEKQELTESSFRFRCNEVPVAVEKLSEGIRLFTQDMNALLSIVEE